MPMDSFYADVQKSLPIIRVAICKSQQTTKAACEALKELGPNFVEKIAHNLDG